MSDGILTSQSLKNKNLVDQQGLQIKKLYVYKITNHKDKGFIKERTLSILHIEPTQVFSASRDETIKSLTQVNKANNSKGNTALLDQRDSNNQYSSEEHIKQDGHVLIATADKELVITKGVPNTDVYFIDNIQASLLKPIKVHGKTDNFNPTSFELTNVKDITDNYKALMFLYTFSKELVDPTNCDIQLNNYTLLSKIMAKGVVEGKKHQDIDLEIDDTSSSKLSLLTMTPTSTNYKLSNFSHWLDANRTLPFVKAKSYLTSNNLKDLFSSTNKDFSGWSPTEILDAYKVIISMMKLTLAFATKFSDYRDKGTGKIKPDIKINDILVIGYENESAHVAVDGLLETWKSKYPAQIDSAGFKIMLEIISMLTQHIKSTYAIGGGSNDFHKVYLPWYFVPTTAITHDIAEDGDFDVILKSEYFTLEQANPLSIKVHYKDISGYLAHDLNGWISQPELPNKITPINKFARPSNVNTKSDEDLKYLFYIPFVDSSVLENLYGELHTTQQTGWHDEGIVRHFSKTKQDDHLLAWECHLGATSKPSGSCHKISKPTESEIKKLIDIPTGYKLKKDSITNIKIVEESCLESEKMPFAIGYAQGQCLDGWLKYTLTYRIECDYELQINGSITISSIQHKGTIFDKLNWRSVCNGLTNGNDKYLLSLKPSHKFNLKIERINEINIQAEWLDELSINISNGTDIISFDNIELPSMDDETITNFTILL